MSTQNQVYDKPLGYAQGAAGNFDTAKLVGTLQFDGRVAGIPAGTQLLLIVAEGQAIRWRDGAIAPTAAIGQPLAVGVELRYYGNPAALQIIGQVAGGVVNVTAFG
jgi:hypothetical protein